MSRRNASRKAEGVHVCLPQVCLWRPSVYVFVRPPILRELSSLLTAPTLLPSTNLTTIPNPL